jgi:TRAP-type C4-dicarboxylate transport system substrate-binding protein
VYTALQQGVIDACEMPLDFAYNNGLHKLATNVMLTNHLVYTNLMIVNTEWFNSLLKETQAILIEEANAAGDYQTQMVVDSEVDLLKTMEEEGCTVYEVDTDAFAESVTPVFENWNDKWSEGLYESVNSIE